LKDFVCWPKKIPIHPRVAALFGRDGDVLLLTTPANQDVGGLASVSSK